MDLIERQVAIDAVKDADVCVFYSDNQSIDDVLDYTIRATKGSVIASIEQLPSAEPEVIHCKDCNYACIDSERESDEIYCSENDFWKDDDFYCGYAERRTDG